MKKLAMEFTQYLLGGTFVFIFTIVIGLGINIFFENVFATFDSPTISLRFGLGLLQLLTVLSIMYLLNSQDIIPHESYLSHELSATFLFSLQTMLITNFKHIVVSLF